MNLLVQYIKQMDIKSKLNSAAVTSVAIKGQLFIVQMSLDIAGLPKENFTLNIVDKYVGVRNDNGNTWSLKIVDIPKKVMFHVRNVIALE